VGAVHAVKKSVRRFLLVLAMAATAATFQLVVPSLPPQAGYRLSDLLIAVAGGYASASYLRRARRLPGRERAGMLAGCLAAGMWSTANMVYLLTSYGFAESGRQVGDLLSVAASISVPVGLLLLAPPVHRMARFRRFIDIAAVSGATFALTWQFVLAPSLHRLGTGPALLTAALILPEVLAAAIALVTMSGSARKQSGPALRLLAVATIVLAVSALLSLRNAIEALPWYTAGVSGGYVFAAGLMALASREPLSPAQPSSGKQLVTGGWTLLTYTPIILTVAATATMQLRTGTLGPVFVWLLLATFSLVLLRQFLTLATVSALAVKLAEQKEALAHRAHHDPLTGLPNRAAFSAAGSAALTAGRHPIMVMLLDLDGFKPVNDTFGHAAGDEVLVTVSTRLTAALRPPDLAARLGGDEFVVLVTDFPAGTELCIAERLLQSISEPMVVHANTITVGCSIGVTTSRAGSSDDLSSLLKQADIAMYAAKTQGKGLIRSYQSLDAIAQSHPVS
jgi:diguanylate cyclase (GGDEF)-like protein